LCQPSAQKEWSKACADKKQAMKAGKGAQGQPERANLKRFLPKEKAA
jgi:hypothetical protein